MKDLSRKAAKIHERVPPDWYVRSIRENILQRFWHTRRFREVSKIIERTNGNILDIGCADGTFTKVILDRSGADRIVGVDVLESSIAFAKKRFSKNKKMLFRVADAHRLPFKNNSFDAVFCLETLEHVEKPDGVLSEIKRVLRRDGYVVVLVPSENFLFRFIVWPLWLAWRGRIWRGTHLHKFSANQVVRLIKKVGFQVEQNHKFLLGMLQAVKAKPKPR